MLGWIKRAKHLQREKFKDFCGLPPLVRSRVRVRYLTPTHTQQVFTGHEANSGHQHALKKYSLYPPWLYSSGETEVWQVNGNTELIIIGMQVGGVIPLEVFQWCWRPSLRPNPIPRPSPNDNASGPARMGTRLLSSSFHLIHQRAV